VIPAAATTAASWPSVAAAAAGNASLVRSGPRESLEIHPVAVAAERNRLTGVPVPLWA